MPELTQDADQLSVLALDGDKVKLTCVDPGHVAALAKISPSRAAFECMKGLTQLGAGHRILRRKFIAATYLIAFALKADEVELEKFAFNHHTYLSSEKLQNTELVRERLIYKVFEFTFCHAGTASKNRAYSYAYGLDYYLRGNSEPKDVLQLIMTHGPEKLYREAVERKRLSEALKSYQLSGRSPSAPVDESYLREHAGAVGDSGKEISRLLSSAEEMHEHSLASTPDTPDFDAQLAKHLHELEAASQALRLMPLQGSQRDVLAARVRLLLDELELWVTQTPSTSAIGGTA